MDEMYSCPILSEWLYANDLYANVGNVYFFFICARPTGNSYLYFTQFKAELKGAKIEYANAYVSIKKHYC